MGMVSALGRVMRTFLRNNGLSLVLLALFVASFVGQTTTGRAQYNEERVQHGEPPVSYAGYVRSGHFLEATMENWESEFLQMASYVLLTAFLYQRGSAESKDPDRPDASADARPRMSIGAWVYEHSLSLALLALFVMSFALHAVGGARAYNEEQIWEGAARLSPLDYVMSSRFWFESFQNWQSEFFSIWAMIVLSIFLRQKGSPESKPIGSPNGQTGTG